MPSFNMSGTAAANPSAGKAIIMSPFSGPKNSPFDAATITGYSNGVPTKANDPNNLSTGGLNTGIGFGARYGINPTAPASIKAAGFNDDYTPGVTMPNGVAATLAILLAIGGGKNSIVNGTGPNGNGTPAGTNVSLSAPYNVQPILGFGNGGTRDAGAGPAFTGFAIKMVTAVADVANGGVVETGWVNRTGVTLLNTFSAFGSASAASAAVT